VLAELGGLVAVRSSAVGEDGAASSFAGQHLTVLGVTHEVGLLEAIRAVFDSGRAASALAYRATHGLDLDPRMGVVIQSLVRADVAGVAFSKNPVSQKDERVIEASWGLGEAVVQGIVTPDSYRVARGGELLEQSAGEKDLAIRWSDAGELSEVPVDAALIHELCLTPAMLLELDSLVSRCEAAFGGTQDIEFAFAGGELFLLQRRPISSGSK
jgi:pyruvate,water dikinase